jgi:hypothetical protein
MRSALGWAAAVVIGLAALVALIAIINSRDTGGVDQQQASSAGPGSPYRGQPRLSPALKDAVKRGNVVVVYRDAKPPAGTQQLVPPGGHALAQAGQSVVLTRDPTLNAPLAAISTSKVERAETPQQLQQFINYWLGGG